MHLQLLTVGVIPRSPKQMPAMQAEAADDASLSHDDSEEEDEDDSSAAWAAMNLPEMDDATRQLILDSIKANAASDEEEDEEELRRMLTQPSAAVNLTVKLPLHTAAEDATAAADILDVEAEAPDTPELLQADSTSPQQGVLESSHDLHQLDNDKPIVSNPSQAVRLPHRKVDAESLEDYEQWDQDYWRNKEPEAVGAALAAAQIWSRIIRTPRKRGKHIIIDVCSPREHETDADAVDTSNGHLVRQVVATTDKKTWLGPGGYRLARKSRWGDLWPKYYQDYALTHKV